MLVLLLLFFAVYTWWLVARFLPGAAESAIANAPSVEVQKFTRIGCFPLLAGDSTSEISYWDKTCMQESTGGLCRSGFPFYTFAKAGGHVIGTRLCAEFCLIKGFDVSGVADSVQCRCGATEDNKYIWADAPAPFTRTDLYAPPSTNVVADASDECRIVASKYVGAMPIPEGELDISETDLSYLNSIFLGKSTPQLVDANGPPGKVPVLDLDYDPGESEVPVQDFITEQWIENTTFGAELRKTLDMTFRQCFPHQCSAGLPWPIKTTYANGVPFAFAPSVPPEARHAFRAATFAYFAATCIPFTEVSPSYNSEYKIFVKNDEDGCWTSPMGYPILYRTDTEMNLGWCNSMLQVGNIIHELGHAMGMAHEHMRSDRDKYVKIDFANMAPMWRAQYQKDNRAFTGAQATGAEPYDFGSLMHYPANKDMRTLPIVNGRGVHDSETGQRREFSELDVVQLRTMYKCDEDVGSECLDMDDELGAAVKLRGRPATCSQMGRYCKHAKYGKQITYFCRRMCNNCPKPIATLSEVSVQGCTDVNEYCSRYKAFCPGGGRSGNQQWMSDNCRKTCMIPKYCGGFGLQNSDVPPVSRPDPSLSAGGVLCMDDPVTGFFNMNGQAQSCSQLQDKCRSPDKGAEVRAKCPATCKVCRGDLGDTSNTPMLDSMEMTATFTLESGGFNLDDADQEAQLKVIVADIVHQIWSDATASISHDPACQAPCYTGTMKFSTTCCSMAVQGCAHECEEVHDEFLEWDVAKLQDKFHEQSVSGLNVEKVSVQTTLGTVTNSIFSSNALIAGLSCALVAVCICCVFALTHARCFKDYREKRLREEFEHRLIEAGEVDEESS